MVLSQLFYLFIYLNLIYYTDSSYINIYFLFIILLSYLILTSNYFILFLFNLYLTFKHCIHLFNNTKFNNLNSLLVRKKNISSTYLHTQTRGFSIYSKLNSETELEKYQLELSREKKNT